MKIVDKIILSNDIEKNSAIKEGIPKEKLLVLGSPKIDAMVKELSNQNNISSTWETLKEKKTVYLLNTGCMYFSGDIYKSLEDLLSILSIPRYIESSAVIWRPHPLTRSSIAKYKNDFLDYFDELIRRISDKNNMEYSSVIYDDSRNYINALLATDVLISKEGSLINSFLLTQKKVIYWDVSMPKNSLLPDNSFYFGLNKEQPLFELIKMFDKGLDPLAANRDKLADKVFVNTKGNVGEKIHSKIKGLVLHLFEEEK
ncbi:hypothetical protein ABER02_13430 [Rossellomorea marisflavi]|uniref:hypothetical protein n=1 Tax=Rossellomorea marisflavi TaxID=189381 RepID=UPI003D2BEE9D